MGNKTSWQINRNKFYNQKYNYCYQPVKCPVRNGKVKSYDVLLQKLLHFKLKLEFDHIVRNEKSIYPLYLMTISLSYITLATTAEY